jgi:hypothetical protein
MNSELKASHRGVCGGWFESGKVLFPWVAWAAEGCNCSILIFQKTFFHLKYFNKLLGASRQAQCF